MMGRQIDGVVVYYMRDPPPPGPRPQSLLVIKAPLVINATFQCAECRADIPSGANCYADPTAERVSDGGPGLLPPIDEPNLLCSNTCLAAYERPRRLGRRNPR